MNGRTVAEWVWYDTRTLAALARATLAPASALFGAAVARRNRLFDDVPAAAVLPALSVGNVTVGGTGKTPVASWFARQLAARGARPAIILRGYGDDEWRVHQLLTPRVPVVVGADRVHAMVQAQQRGADCAVLDDAFQHRRAHRVADVVLVNVDRFRMPARLLPAGPYRERLSALRRATAVVLTRKAAADEAVARAEAVIREEAPQAAVAIVRLLPQAVQRVPSAGAEAIPVSENVETSEPLGWLRHRRLLLTSAIADPDAFERQLIATGMQLVRHVRFPDHHAFSDAEIARLADEARRGDGVLCTLKDAVKLGPRWPREAPPLWYVSQTLVVDRGAEVLERECDRVLAARDATVPTVG